jgi:hypothetical protein
MSSLSKTITKIRTYLRRNPQQVDRGRRIVRDRLSRRRGGRGGQGNPPSGSI